MFLMLTFQLPEHFSTKKEDGSNSQALHHVVACFGVGLKINCRTVILECEQIIITLFLLSGQGYHLHCSISCNKCGFQNKRPFKFFSVSVLPFWFFVQLWLNLGNPAALQPCQRLGQACYCLDIQNFSKVYLYKLQ